MACEVKGRSESEVQDLSIFCSIHCHIFCL